MPTSVATSLLGRRVTKKTMAKRHHPRYKWMHKDVNHISLVQEKIKWYKSNQVAGDSKPVDRQQDRQASYPSLPKVTLLGVSDSSKLCPS